MPPTRPPAPVPPPVAPAAECPSVDEAGLGELAAQYELLSELGRGGSAVVYRARDRRLRRDVALKAVRLTPALHPHERAAEVARLAREARTTARLAHPNIVTVYAVHELRDGLAVAMQYVSGCSLKQLLADDGALDPGRAARLLGEVARALAYAHAHGVVHRDVKPENIFVDGASGRALLADFGAARAGEADVRVTRTGVTVGTPAYMAPEQIDGGPLDGRADLYSLGLVAWEALTGRRPWEGAGLYQVLHHQKHDVLPPVAAVRPAQRPPVPLDLEYVVARLLEKRPAARWASAEVVAEQLEHPVPPADFKLWAREHRRRLAAAATGTSGGLGGARATVVLEAHTEEFRPGPATAAGGTRATVGPAASPASVDGTAAGERLDDAPSWARPRQTHRRRWYAGAAAGAVAAVALATALPAVPRHREAPPSGASSAVVPDVAAGTVVPRPAAPGATGAPAGGADRSPGGMGEANPRGTGALAPLAPQGAPLADPVLGDTGRRVTVVVARPGASPARSTPPAVVPRVGPPATSTPPAVAPTTPAAAPARPVGVPRVLVSSDRAVIAAGAGHTCALDGAGRALCWGANESGQLGAGSLAAHEVPTSVVGDLRFTQVTTGGAHSCGLAADGDAYCWGDDDHGQLGDAAAGSRDAPVRVAGAASYAVLRAGLDHTCGLTAAGAVACWGANRRGQLGDGTTRDRVMPTLVPGLRAVALAAGWRHTCALTAQGTAVCWGDNQGGQLGDGTRAPRYAPVAVAGDRRFVALAAGATHTCGASADGATYCWGTGGAGASAVLAPARVDGGPPFVALAAGSVHTCGRTAGGLVYCWGRNPYGQLGDGGVADRWRPARVAGGPYSTVSAAGAHTCAVAHGAPLCWGYNVSGQLGNGTRAHHATPVRVAGTGP